MKRHSCEIMVNTNCVADTYATLNERIIEFSSPGGGGLISFRLETRAMAVRLVVEVYRHDPTVVVVTNTGYHRSAEVR